MNPTLGWHKEAPPRWDAEKLALFDDAELAAVGLARPAAGAVLPDEWWRVTDESGAVVGYGWLDAQWGDAQITFFVAPDRRGQGVGEFIVSQLERESAARGLNYIYNVVPESHPNAAWMNHWLALHGFLRSAHGDLRRQIGAPTGGG